MTKLTQQAQYEIQNQVNKTLSKWAKIIGVTNLIFLIGLFGYVFFIFPDQVIGPTSEKVVEELKGRTKNLLNELEDEHVEAFVLIGNIEERAKNHNQRLVALKVVLESLENELESVSKGVNSINTPVIEKLVNFIESTTDSEEIVSFAEQTSRLKEDVNQLKDTIDSLGMIPEKQKFVINGPRIGGADAHECPPGYFVTSLHASGSVGGKYGVDGISEIRFSCSPLVSKK